MIATDQGTHFGYRAIPVLAIILTAFSLWADTTGRVSGVVKDSSGAVVAGVQVALTNKAMGLKTTAKTDKKGSYSFLSVAAGQYDMQTAAAGFKPFTRRVVIHVDTALRVDIVLEASDKTAAVTR